MRFLFFGAGAIGAYIGGSLARDGHTVGFIERPEVAGLLRREGLELQIGEQTHRIPAPGAYADADEALQADAYDAAVIALKSYDTAAAIEPLKALQGRLPPALCLQNGVENEAAWEAAFGAGQVIAGTVTSAVGRSRAGAVRLERKRGVGIAAGHPLSIPIAEAFQRAGLNARLYRCAPSMKWSKMLTNLIANASAAILGLTPQEIYADPRLFKLEREMLRECLRVMRAGRIVATDLPGTPVRGLALAVERLPAVLARPILAQAVGGGRGGKLPSLAIDLQSGRGRSEVDWLNGAVVRGGRRAGVPTPVNARLTEVLLGLAEGVEKKEKFANRPEALIASLDSATLKSMALY